MSRDFQKGGVGLMKHMQVGGNIEILFMIFDHVKCTKVWTMQTCHVYGNKYWKVLTIACCDIQSKDGATQTLLWENLNLVMAENRVSRGNFKKIMMNNAQANWNALKKTVWRFEATRKCHEILSRFEVWVQNISIIGIVFEEFWIIKIHQKENWSTTRCEFHRQNELFNSSP